MPRGVYERKKKNTDETAAAAPAKAGVAKTKRTWKLKGPRAARSTESSVAGSDRSSAFSALTNYLTAIGSIRAQQTSQNPKLDQEFEATISTLRNMREQLYSVSTEEVISGESGGTRNSTPASASAPVPFNPPQFSGQVAQQ